MVGIRTENEIKIIEDEKTHAISGNLEKWWHLEIKGSRQASLVQHKDGRVDMHWGVYGPVSWTESKVLLAGLLELSMLADQLHHQWERRTNGRSRKKRDD